MWKKILIALGIAGAAAGCGDDGGGGSPILPPVASLVATPDKGPKSLEVVLDASGSLAGTGEITAAYFDFDGDGIDDYVETPASNDGIFDLKTTATYPTEGDFTPTVTIADSEYLSDFASASVGVGFGDDKTGAVDYAEATLAGISYICTRDQDFQLFNPTTGQMTACTGLKAELSDQVLYVIYDWDSLAQEQKDTLTARAAEGMTAPEVVVIAADDSPLTIESILGGF